MGCFLNVRCIIIIKSSWSKWKDMDSLSPQMALYIIIYLHSHTEACLFYNQPSHLKARLTTYNEKNQLTVNFLESVYLRPPPTHYICVFVCLILFIYCIYLFIYLSIYLFIYLSIIYIFIYLSIYCIYISSIHLYIYLFICLSIYLSIHVCLSIQIHLSIYLSIYLSICISIHFSFYESHLESDLFLNWSNLHYLHVWLRTKVSCASIHMPKIHAIYSIYALSI